MPTSRTLLALGLALAAAGVALSAPPEAWSTPRLVAAALLAAGLAGMVAFPQPPRRIAGLALATAGVWLLPPMEESGRVFLVVVLALLALTLAHAEDARAVAVPALVLVAVLALVLLVLPASLLASSAEPRAPMLLFALAGGCLALALVARGGRQVVARRARKAPHSQELQAHVPHAHE